jgi:carbon monoxide dehydrogenase subunit G
MKPIEVFTEISINAPADAIWPYLVDWENLGDWMEEASDFLVTSNHREGVGVTAEATVKIGGIKTRDAIRVATWEPPRLLVIEHLSWVKGSGRLSSIREGGGSLLTWKETLVPPLGIAGALGMRLFKPLMRRIFQRDLETLKRLVEEPR